MTPKAILPVPDYQRQGTSGERGKPTTTRRSIEGLLGVLPMTLSRFGHPVGGTTLAPSASRTSIRDDEGRESRKTTGKGVSFIVGPPRRVELRSRPVTSNRFLLPRSLARLVFFAFPDILTPLAGWPLFLPGGPLWS